MLDLPIEEMTERYEDGESTGELGRAYGVDGKTIWRRLVAGGVKMRSPGEAGGGQRKLGGPLHVGGRGYLRTYDRAGKVCRVHRGCWEAYGGPIPARHDIHHLNRDKLDNRIENLDCISHAAHTALPKRA